MYLSETDVNWWMEEGDVSRSVTQTAIYKFAISAERPQYLATGTVDGRVLNQFSFSEFGGYLRTATTQFETVSDPVAGRQIRSSTNVFVLEDDGNRQLNIAGAARGIAPGESMRSSRFVGNRGYVVTFRQVDPLFALDLSEPTDPQLMGELTVPGFSTYMHPFGDNYLITIGRNDNLRGMKLQLVNVSDITDPIIAHSYSPNMSASWSWSSAEYDHKAFMFYDDANLLSIPVHINPYTARGDTNYFSGFLAFNVSPDTGFNPLGEVDHQDLAREFYCSGVPDPQVPIGDDCVNGWVVRYAMPRRSFVMTGEANQVYLYTMSEAGVKAAEQTGLADTLGSMVFPANPYPWWPLPVTDAPVASP
jgi:hypothetical protein